MRRASIGSPRQRWLKTHNSAGPRRKYIGCVGRCCCCRTRPLQPRRAFAMRVKLHADRMLASGSCAPQPASSASGATGASVAKPAISLPPSTAGSSKASARRCWKTPRLCSCGRIAVGYFSAGMAWLAAMVAVSLVRVRRDLRHRDGVEIGVAAQQALSTPQPPSYALRKPSISSLTIPSIACMARAAPARSAPPRYFGSADGTICQEMP
jgi:hypothetical protein